MIPIWPALANHLWQSTLFAVVAVLLTLVLNKNRARMRYRLWLAASIKFLVPFSLFAGLGSYFESRNTPEAGPRPASAIEQLGQPFAVTPVPAHSAPASRASLVPVVLFAAWSLGSALVLFVWWRRWRQIRKALRAASPLQIHARIKVMSSPIPLEPGVFGIFRPVLLLPDGISNRLTPAQFKAILAHEFCHVRRRDNLAAAIHMVSEAVFWFYPLVWWIGRRLMEERECACDEEVLRLGNEPQAYAQGIVNVCKHYLESPLACASGVTGADLRKRIEAIMTHRNRLSLTFAKKLLVALAGVVVAAGTVVTGMLSATRVQAQSQTGSLRFEVATIKPVKNGGGRGGMQILSGGGLRMGGVTVKNLIALAYNVRESQISGGAGWIGSDAFDLNAKPEQPDAGTAQPAPGTPTWIRLEQRLQTLLQERFHLAVHKESKPGQVYALVFVKNGPKLRPAERDDVPPGTMRSRNQIVGRAGTMSMLANLFSNWLGRPVEDRTGLTGRYDYVLEYAPDPSMGGRGGPFEPPSDANPPDSSGPSVFTALQEQLGLKLESARGSIVTLVIDRVEKPTEN